MRPQLPILACLCLAACSGVPESPSAIRWRSDVLYFNDTESGRSAAREVIELFEGKQEVVLISEILPPLQPPSPIFQALPEYPTALKEAGIGGSVTVDFIVDEFGNVPYAVVVATTEPGLNAAAIDAVLRSKFKPAQRSGTNVRSHLRAPLWFSPPE